MSGARLGFAFDSTIELGAGHLSRCTTLIESAIGSGLECVVSGELDGPLWAVNRVHALMTRGLNPIQRRAPLREFVERAGLDLLVIDRYGLSDDELTRVMPLARTVLFEDGDTCRPCHVLLNPNLGGASRQGKCGAIEDLTGPDFAMMRTQIVESRPELVSVGTRVKTIAVTLGASDPVGLILSLLRALLAVSGAFEVHVVCQSQQTAELVNQLDVPPDKAVRVILGTGELVELMRSSDLVITGSGTTLLELCCLGTPSAAVKVADNQSGPYSAAVAQGLTTGLGDLQELRDAPQVVTARIQSLLDDPALRMRQAERGHSAVDGRGADRVIARLEKLLGSIGEQQF